MHSITSSRSRARRRAWVIVLVLAVLASVVSYLVTAQGASIPDSPEGAAVESFGIDDGYIDLADPLSPFNDGSPAISGLDSQLRDAIQAAASDALADGFDFVVTSGWRSTEYQRALFAEAVIDYGSAEEASRHVSPAESSTHVTGNAVDIGYTDANSWLSQHGAEYGLCQIYANEMWHYELATAPGGECPPQLPDASYRS